MRLNVRGVEVELKPLYFKDWADMETQGLDKSRLARMKKCEGCNGAGKLTDGSECKDCKGAGLVSAARLSDLWIILNLILRKAGVAQEIIDTFSVDEVNAMFASTEVMSFLLQKAAPAVPIT